MKSRNFKKLNNNSIDENVSYQLVMEDNDATTEDCDLESPDGIENSSQVLSNIEVADEFDHECVVADETNIKQSEPLENLDDEFNVADITDDIKNNDPLITPLLKAIIEDEPVVSSDLEKKILEKVVRKDTMKEKDLGDRLIDDVIENGGVNIEYIKQQYDTENKDTSEKDRNNKYNRYIELLRRQQLNNNQGETIESDESAFQENKDNNAFDSANEKAGSLRKEIEGSQNSGFGENNSEFYGDIDEENNHKNQRYSFSNPNYEDDVWYTNNDFDAESKKYDLDNFDNSSQELDAFSEERYSQNADSAEDRFNHGISRFEDGNHFGEKKTFDESFISKSENKEFPNQSNIKKTSGYVASEVEEGDSSCFDEDDNIESLLNDMGFYRDEYGNVLSLNGDDSFVADNKTLSDEKFEKYLEGLGACGLKDKVAESGNDANGNTSDANESGNDANGNTSDANESGKDANGKATDVSGNSSDNNSGSSDDVNGNDNNVALLNNVGNNQTSGLPNTKNSVVNSSNISSIVNNITRNSNTVSENINENERTVNKEDDIEFEDFDKEILSGVLSNKKIKTANKNKDRLIRLYLDDGQVTCKICGHINKKGTIICEMCSNYLEEK